MAKTFGSSSKQDQGSKGFYFPFFNVSSISSSSEPENKVKGHMSFIATFNDSSKIYPVMGDIYTRWARTLEVPLGTLVILPVRALLTM